MTNPNKPDNKWWIKWWTHETAYGGLATAPLDELGFLVKLCVCCKLGNYPGYIKATEDEAITHLGIAGMMGMAGDIENFERLLQVHKNKGRVKEDEKGIMEIVNYNYYQNEKGKPRLSKVKLAEIIDNKKANKQTMKAVAQGTTRALNELNGTIQQLKTEIETKRKRGRPPKIKSTEK
jgi:hypothetical protein